MNWLPLVLLLLPTTALAAGFAGPHRRPQSSAYVKVTPTVVAGELETLISGSPASSRFVFWPGIYREQVITPRDGDTYEGRWGPGVALFKGSEDISGDASLVSDLYVVSGRTEQILDLTAAASGDSSFWQGHGYDLNSTFIE